MKYKCLITFIISYAFLLDSNHFYAEASSLDGKSLLCTNLTNIGRKIEILSGFRNKRIVGVFFHDGQVTIFDTTTETRDSLEKTYLSYEMKTNKIVLYSEENRRKFKYCNGLKKALDDYANSITDPLERMDVKSNSHKGLNMRINQLQSECDKNYHRIFNSDFILSGLSFREGVIDRTKLSGFYKGNLKCEIKSRKIIDRELNLILNKRRKERKL